MLPPKSTVFIGCVGKDKYADTLTQAANDVGLRVEYRIDEEVPTGRCGVIITGHNRSMVTELGAANAYKIEHLKSPEIWKLVEQAKVFYVGGYHLTVSPPAIMALAEEAAKSNKVYPLYCPNPREQKSTDNDM
jgi:adenosine kinase